MNKNPPPRSCRTCHFFVQRWIRVAGEERLDAHCWHWYRCFPDATDCTAYEREPGTDDDE